jgi:hypothetical protein
MMQPHGFQVSRKEYMIYKTKKSIYGLKQASRQWYLKFDEVVTSCGFKENIADQCIDLRVNGRKYTLLVLYVDDILLAENDTGLLLETKHMLSSQFDLKILEKPLMYWAYKFLICNLVLLEKHLLRRVINSLSLNAL